jgi:hypothetical protein
VPCPAPVPRRAALLGLGVAVLLAGCDHGDDIGAPASDGPTTATTASSTAPAPTPDEALVEATLERLTTAFGVLVTARTFTALRPTVSPLIRAHRRHVEVLEGEVGGWVAPDLADPAAALHAVRRSEQRLRAALADAAGRAESGALARLLASMSASTSQHLASLPKEA